MTEAETFSVPIAREIWERKYRWRSPDGRSADASLDETFWRVARAAAVAEKGGKRAQERWAQRFHGAMADLGFLPAGRILAGAGTGRAVTLFNCFVMGPIADDLGSIFDNVKEAALTMQQGGGIGHDFSTLRPKGALVASIGADASGPVSFMDVWDSMCRTIMSAGARRGAMMGTMRCDHPDILDFISVKADASRLRNFNLSVLVTDAFMGAVHADAPWDLVFGGKVHRTLPARALWERLMRATYETAEPGVIFIDRVNVRNNLAYCEEIHATNPCGEQPLPAYGACLLGSLNLVRFVEEPFKSGARLDTVRLAERARIAVRFLDNVIDVSNYPLPAQRREAKAKRRIGLGVTGLADALAMMGVRYGTHKAEVLAGQWMAAIADAAYAASAELAAEKGSFPLFNADKFLASPNVAVRDRAVRELVRKAGIRNGCLTSIAPTGTISLLAGNVSSGIEPIFDYRALRRVLEPDGSHHDATVEDYAVGLFRRDHGAVAPLPEAFVKAADLTPAEHLVMQAAVQAHTDSSISKTVNCPADMAFGDFKGVYDEAYALGLKGCTTFRPNAVTGAVLTPVPAGETAEGAGVAGAIEPAALHLAPERVSVAERAGDVVYMSPPLEREPALAGFTYKLKWPESDHAIYVTLNDIEQGGRRRPFEIFINTRNLEHYAWTVALTRMISAVFRRGGDVSFVAEELKAVFDPQGGRWMDGRYVPSLLAAIGDVIERHMIRIGFLVPQGGSATAGDGVYSGLADNSKPVAAEHGRRQLSGAAAGEALPQNRRGAEARGRGGEKGRACPRCSVRSFVRREGCWVCESCGFSRCS